MTQVKIGIADDHLVVQQGLKALLSTTPTFEIVSFSKTGREALDMVQSHALDVLILDIHMPGTNAMDVLHGILTVAPALKVVIYSGLPEACYAPPMFRLGAHAYVEKSASSANLVRAIESVMQPGFHPTDATADADTHGASVDRLFPSDLTPREFQIFIRLASGQKVGRIAQSLGVSVVTVSTHRASVLRKLNLKNNHDLTKYALANAFVS